MKKSSCQILKWSLPSMYSKMKLQTPIDYTIQLFLNSEVVHVKEMFLLKIFTN